MYAALSTEYEFGSNPLRVDSNFLGLELLYVYVTFKVYLYFPPCFDSESIRGRPWRAERRG